MCMRWVLSRLMPVFLSAAVIDCNPGIHNRGVVGTPRRWLWTLCFVTWRCAVRSLPEASVRNAWLFLMSWIGPGLSLALFINIRPVLLRGFGGSEEPQKVFCLLLHSNLHPVLFCRFLPILIRISILLMAANFDGRLPIIVPSIHEFTHYHIW